MPMANPENGGPRGPLPSNVRARRGFGHLLLWALALLCLADVAEARITIRHRSPYDVFFFHGNYSTDPFDPSDGFRLEVWNCANGQMPTFVADREPLIVCADDANT